MYLIFLKNKSSLMIYLLVEHIRKYTYELTYQAYKISKISVGTNEYAFISILRMIPLICTPYFYILNDTQINKQISCNKICTFWGVTKN